MVKGLILSGGKGTRLRPLTYTSAKQLLPLANKPVLFYAIESLVKGGIRDLGIIVGDTQAEVRAVVGDGSRWGADVHICYIHQPEPLGLAHAVLTARQFIGDDRFIMVLGDNLVGEPLTDLIQEFGAPDCDYHCRILLSRVANPGDFGVAELAPEPEGDARVAGVGAEPRVRRLIEKPRQPPSDLALVGVYCFDRHIFEAAERIHPSARGELEITDAIQWLINSGFEVRPHLLQSYWIDTGKMEDILAANRQVLASLAPRIEPSAHISADSVLQGAVAVEAGAEVLGSVVRGPAIIGERVRLVNAYVGPFSSISHDVMVDSSEIEYCIVLEHSRIIHVASRIEASLIGRYAEVYGSTQKPRGHTLMLGDYSKVGLWNG